MASPLFRLDTFQADDLAPAATDGLHRARAIQVAPRSIVTDERIVELRARHGHLLADPENDVALVALLERGRGTNEVGAASSADWVSAGER